MAGDAIMTKYNDNGSRASASTKKFLNDSGLSHVFSLITSFVRNYASPKTHNHDGVYAKSSHTHATSQVTGLDSALAGKASTSHTHTIAQVTNLQSSLDSKTPNSRKVNGKPLSTDITLTSADVKADAAGSATNALNSAKQYTDTVAAGKAAKSHVHDATNITTGTLSQDRLPLVPVAKGGTGKTNGKDAANYLINSLEEGTSTPTDADKILTQYVGGGTTNTTYVRRPLSTLWSYIKPKCDAVYQAKGSYAAASHTHAISNITNLQAQLDGKQAKGSYASASHNHDSVYSKLNHTHSYLPLSGGSISGQIKKTSSGSTSWVHGRDTATVRNTISGDSNYEPILSSKTQNGSWEFGTYVGDTMHLSYITDENYNKGNNALTANIQFKTNNTIVANVEGNATSASTVPWSGVTNIPSMLRHQYTLNSSHDMNNIRATGIYVVENSMPKNYCGQAWANVIVLGIAGWTRQYAIASSDTYIRVYGGEPAQWSGWTNSALSSYPVGAVYISYSSTSPASLFGGSWVALTGVFPYFNAGTGRGGSNSHTLSVNEMPNHRHLNADWSNCGDEAWNYGLTYGGNGFNGRPLVGTSHVKSVYATTYSGSSAAHNNMPAYQTLYAWRRTG